LTATLEDVAPESVEAFFAVRDQRLFEAEELDAVLVE
jgi:hypothetical protein